MMTHAELCTLGERWLRKRTKPNYPIVLTDVRCNAISEQPDVIGWTTRGASLLIECKTSRSDFFADATKSFRRYPADGMGLLRYYLAPEDVIPAQALHDGRWGLLIYTHACKFKIARHALPNILSDRALTAEKMLLLSAVRRVTEGWGRRMFGEAAPPIVNGDPHPTASGIITAQQKQIIALTKDVKALQVELNRKT